MNIHRQTLACSLVVALFTITSGCATVEHVDVPRAPMTIRQARKSLAESLAQMWFTKSLREVSFTRQKVTYKFDETYSTAAGKTSTGTIAFAKVGKLSLARTGGNGATTADGTPIPASVTEVMSHGRRWMVFETREAATNFVEALFTLKEAALAPDTVEADFVAFTSRAKSWLAASPRPGISDEARTQKLLAEDAFNRKDFTAALDAYSDALDKSPMWPEGHFNAALLAAEVEDYELAAHHMRRYLALAPDAQDAPAAKDKFLLWDAKAKL